MHGGAGSWLNPCNSAGQQFVEAVAALPESATEAIFAVRAIYRSVRGCAVTCCDVLSGQGHLPVHAAVGPLSVFLD